ncbi:MAG: tetratricopeptide repeat protein [Magnetococcales bacterium]|nr:tetratricopeptide repeat protein [Magnetococcales bacterium]
MHRDNDEKSSIHQRALALYTGGETAAALALIEQGLVAAAGDAGLLNLAAACHLQLGDAEQAIACWQHLIDLHPDHADAHANLAVVLRQLQRPAEAELACRAALRIEPQHANAWVNLGALLQAQNRPIEAEAAYRQALRSQPEHVEACSGLGALLHVLGRPDAAEAMLRHALHLQPGYAVAHYNLGVLLQDGGRLTEAEVCHRRVIDLDPGYVDAHVNLGVVLQRLGQPVAAEVHHRQAIALQPTCADAWANLGVLLQGLGRFTAAEAALRQALHHRPGQAEVYNNLGLLLHKQKEYVAAEEALRRAIALQPGYVEAHNNLGLLLQELGRRDEAETALRQAVAHAPDNASLHVNLGALLQETGQQAAAEACYLRALALDPKAVDGHLNLGILLRCTGRFDAAEASFREVLRLRPDDGAGRYQLGSLLRQLHRCEPIPEFDPTRGGALVISARQRRHPLAVVAPEDFHCRGDGIPGAPPPARFTPYCFDLVRELLLGVCADPIALLSPAFFFQAQYDQAESLHAVPFSALAATFPDTLLRRTRLVFLYSVGRCGSTLLSRALQTLPGVVSISEPDFPTQIMATEPDPAEDTAWLVHLLRHAVVALCRPYIGDGGRCIVLKFRAECLFRAELLQRAFPAARNIFMTRNPHDWARSAYTAFAATPEEIARRWVKLRQQHTRAVALGMDFYQIGYENLLQQPLLALQRLCARCDLPAPDPEAVAVVFARDAQKGSSLSRDVLRAGPRRGMTLEEMAEFQRLIVSGAGVGDVERL